MKRLSINKLLLIIGDWKNNGIDCIDQDQMDKLYTKYGDDVFFDEITRNVEIAKEGPDYKKLTERINKNEKI